MLENYAFTSSPNNCWNSAIATSASTHFTHEFFDSRKLKESTERKIWTIPIEDEIGRLRIREPGLASVTFLWGMWVTTIWSYSVQLPLGHNCIVQWNADLWALLFCVNCHLLCWGALVEVDQSLQFFVKGLQNFDVGYFCWIDPAGILGL